MRASSVLALLALMASARTSAAAEQTATGGPVSFGARGKTPGRIAVPPEAAELVSLRLEYVSGGVSCRDASYAGRWGCRGLGLQTVVADAEGALVWPALGGGEGVAWASAARMAYSYAGHNESSAALDVGLGGRTLSGDALYVYFTEDYFPAGQDADNALNKTTFNYALTYQR
eukprot:m51a1_g13071 hypothetical protein (173) ;mRNA; f:1901-2735